MPGTLESGRLVAPAEHGFPIIPDDNADLIAPTRGLWVGTYGDVRLRTVGGSDITLVAVTAGIIHPIRVIRVFATGTNASDIVGLR